MNIKSFFKWFSRDESRVKCVIDCRKIMFISDILVGEHFYVIMDGGTLLQFTSHNSKDTQTLSELRELFILNIGFQVIILRDDLLNDIEISLIKPLIKKLK